MVTGGVEEWALMAEAARTALEQHILTLVPLSSYITDSPSGFIYRKVTTVRPPPTLM